MTDLESSQGPGQPDQINGAMECSRLFGTWLVADRLVVAMACSKGMALLGCDEKGSPSVHFLSGDEMSAIACAPDGTLWAASYHSLHKFENISRSGGYRAGKKDLYLERLRIFTSALGISDAAVDGFGSLLLASMDYSIVGRACIEASMEPVWRPPFVTAFLPESRCGLSGLGLYDGPRHCASSFGRGDTARSWKEGYRDGGVLLALEGGGVLAEGLCLPMAPRWANDTLYVLNSGTAEFGRVDPATKSFQALCQCPGFTTGMTLHGFWAVVSISNQPPKGIADLDLPAGEIFLKRGIQPASGVLVVDVRTGDIAHNAIFEDPCHQVSGVSLIRGCREAATLGADDSKIDPLITLKQPKAAA